MYKRAMTVFKVILKERVSVLVPSAQQMMNSGIADVAIVGRGPEEADLYALLPTDRGTVDAVNALKEALEHKMRGVLRSVVSPIVSNYRKLCDKRDSVKTAYHTEEEKKSGKVTPPEIVKRRYDSVTVKFREELRKARRYAVRKWGWVLVFMAVLIGDFGFIYMTVAISHDAWGSTNPIAVGSCSAIAAIILAVLIFAAKYGPAELKQEYDRSRKQGTKFKLAAIPLVATGLMFSFCIGVCWKRSELSESANSGSLMIAEFAVGLFAAACFGHWVVEQALKNFELQHFNSDVLDEMRLYRNDLGDALHQMKVDEILSIPFDRAANVLEERTVSAVARSADSLCRDKDLMQHMRHCAKKIVEAGRLQRLQDRANDTLTLAGGSK